MSVIFEWPIDGLLFVCSSSPPPPTVSSVLRSIPAISRKSSSLSFIRTSLRTIAVATTDSRETNETSSTVNHRALPPQRELGNRARLGRALAFRPGIQITHRNRSFITTVWAQGRCISQQPAAICPRAFLHSWTEKNSVSLLFSPHERLRVCGQDTVATSRSQGKAVPTSKTHNLDFSWRGSLSLKFVTIYSKLSIYVCVCTYTHNRRL